MNTEIKKITEIMNHEMFDLCADLKRCDISDILNGHFEVDSLGSETLDDLQMRKWLFLELLREDEKEEVLGKICLKNNTKLSLVLLELSEQFDRKNGEFKYTEDEEELICPHCNRNEEECEKNTESVKNPITHWCGWGLSCDDCYYKNHPDDDDEEDESDDTNYTCMCCDNVYTDAQIESGEITRCIRCDKCNVGDCGLTSCYCFDEEYQRECGEGYCSICEEACHLCYRIIDGEPDDTAPMCKYCIDCDDKDEDKDDGFEKWSSLIIDGLLSMPEDEEEVGCTDC